MLRGVIPVVATGGRWVSIVAIVGNVILIVATGGRCDVHGV